MNIEATLKENLSNIVFYRLNEYWAVYKKHSLWSEMTDVDKENYLEWTTPLFDSYDVVDGDLLVVLFSLLGAEKWIID